MPPSKNLSAYEDVFNFLEAALANDGRATLRFSTEGKAKNFHFRSNVFLKLLREKAAAKPGNPYSFGTRYSDLSLSQSLADPTCFQSRPKSEVTPTILDEHGKPLANTTVKMETIFDDKEPPAIPEDSSIEDLTDFATAFARSQGISTD